MSFDKKTIRDISLTGKVVLLRADYNVSIKEGHVVDDYRIAQSLETIKFILNSHAKKLIIIAHLGRPDGKREPEFSLVPVAKKLATLLDKRVNFAVDCIGEVTKKDIAELPDHSVVLLENLRFYEGEEKNSADFAKQLLDATGAEIFVQDAFGVAHRAHASTDAITKLLPSVAGLLLEKEVNTITQAMTEPKRPLVAVVGGAKISDKIDVLKKFIDIADCVLVGGALADDFLRAKHFKIGESLVDDDSVQLAKEVLDKAKSAERERNFNFMIPVDGVVSEDTSGKKPIRLVDLGFGSYASIVDYPKIPSHHSTQLNQNEKILDIGPITAGMFASAIRMSRTVVWSGTMGVTETKGIAGADNPFAHGTQKVVEAIIGDTNNHANKPFSIVGGGDTVAYVESEKLTPDFNHVSTGGSASLELIAGHKLPAVEALADK